MWILLFIGNFLVKIELFCEFSNWVVLEPHIGDLMKEAHFL